MAFSPSGFFSFNKMGLGLENVAFGVNYSGGGVCGFFWFLRGGFFCGGLGSRMDCVAIDFFYKIRNWGAADLLSCWCFCFRVLF